ncbi:LamG-like jellyroll fold domain-containing protein [Bremerella sp. JC770]|uniref:LamG-like jellyroll fold domain-containing protein n=1 Tax=Bremerella sp. JC770 TaxID=3232137 RepID=UPI00345A0F9A
MDPNKAKEFEALINSLLDDGLTDQEKQQLAELLDGDPEAQERYTEHCQMHAMLAWEHGVLPEVNFDSAKTTPSPSRGTNSIRLWQLFAVAASILFVVAFGWSVYLASLAPLKVAKPPEEKPEVDQPTAIPSIPWNKRTIYGSFTQGRGARLAVLGEQFELHQGDSFRNGNYQLLEGFAELRFRNNVEVLLESPAEFEIVNDLKIVMHSGRISAVVSPEGEGFSVETPSIDLTDYGTEFAVEVLPDKTSEVHVFSGEVKVKPKLAPLDMERVQLLANQATRVRESTGIPEGIDVDLERFLRELNESPSPEIGYEALMEELAPVTLLRMAPSIDGITLADYGTQTSDGVLLTDLMSIPPFKPGKIGGSLFLSGPAAMAYAKVPHYQPVATGEITVCGWVRAESRPRWAAIAKQWAIEFDDDDKPHGLGGQFHFGLHDYAGDLEVQVRDKHGNVIKLRENKPFPLATWQHVAFVADGENVRLYRNGIEIDSAQCEGLSTDGPDSMGIGAKLSYDCTHPDDRNPGFWHGRIDELAIFDKALSEQQLLQIVKTVPE